MSNCSKQKYRTSPKMAANIITVNIINGNKPKKCNLVIRAQIIYALLSTLSYFSHLQHAYVQQCCNSIHIIYHIYHIQASVVADEKKKLKKETDRLSVKALARSSEYECCLSYCIPYAHQFTEPWLASHLHLYGFSEYL